MADYDHEQDAGGFFDGPRPPYLIHPDGVRSELNRRLQQEVRGLQQRIQALRTSGSPGSETIIATYERMIANKRRFLSDLSE